MDKRKQKLITELAEITGETFETMEARFENLFCCLDMFKVEERQIVFLEDRKRNLLEELDKIEHTNFPGMFPHLNLEELNIKGFLEEVCAASISQKENRERMEREQKLINLEKHLDEVIQKRSETLCKTCLYRFPINICPATKGDVTFGEEGWGIHNVQECTRYKYTDYKYNQEGIVKAIDEVKARNR